MMKYLVLTFAAVQAALAANVSIVYMAPVLYLNLQGDDLNATAVVFHYTISGTAGQGVGTKTTEGWQYQKRGVDLNDADSVVVYAAFSNSENFILGKTDNTTYKFSNNIGLATLPSRRMRGLVIFRDNFDYINTANWNYELSMFGGKNWEFQVYTPEMRNTFIRNGILYIKPTPTTDDPRFDENFLSNGIMDMNEIWGYCTNDENYGCTREGKYGLLPPIMSGRIMSIPTLRYGIVEVRAKIPKGDWIWPSISMLPRDNAYGSWPRSGEIIIMTSRGNEGEIGVETVSSTLEWGLAWDSTRSSLTHGHKTHKSWHEDFHIFKLEWTPEYLTTSVDDMKIMEVFPGDGFWQKGGFSDPNIWASGEKMAPFDKYFYLVLNVAVGGTTGFFPDNINYRVKKPWSNGVNDAARHFWNARNEWLPTWQGDEAAMLVDYVEFRDL